MQKIPLFTVFNNSRQNMAPTGDTRDLVQKRNFHPRSSNLFYSVKERWRIRFSTEQSGYFTITGGKNQILLKKFKKSGLKKNLFFLFDRKNEL